MTITNYRAAELRREWGDKPCDHPDYDWERMPTGQKSGDVVCTTCGESFWADSPEGKALIAKVKGGNR